MRLSVRVHAQNAPSRDVPRPECAFPSRRGAREVWGNPPPGCGALWRMPQLGKCARATPRQAAGRVARGFANLGLEFGLTEKCTLKPTDWAECTFPSRRPPRVRVFVTLRMQSALFRRMRFSSPGQTWRHLTERRTLGPPPHGKAHFAGVTLTERRSLGPSPHGKAHSGGGASPKSAVCIHNPLVVLWESCTYALHALRVSQRATIPARTGRTSL